MTFQELFEDVNAVFAASYPGAEPKGSPRKTDQLDRVWDSLQALVLSFGLIPNPAREVTATASERFLDLSLLDPPAGGVRSVSEGNLRLPYMANEWFGWQDASTEGTIMAWVMASGSKIGFYPVPADTVTLTLNCIEGLASSLKTSGELPFDAEECSAIADYLSHQLAARPDPNMVIQARRRIGGVSARRLSALLSHHKVQ